MSNDFRFKVPVLERHVRIGPSGITERVERRPFDDWLYDRNFHLKLDFGGIIPMKLRRVSRKALMREYEVAVAAAVEEVRKLAHQFERGGS